MATAYSPGLTVTGKTVHRVKRILPIKGEVRTHIGAKVAAEDVVAETFMPGDVQPLNMAKALSMPPADVGECLVKNEGERIEIDEILARTKGIFGMFKNEYKSPVNGTLEAISEITGQLIVRGEPLPVQVLAYMSGEVVEILESEGCVIESEVAFIQGIFGIGGEAFGTIVMACEDHEDELTSDRIKAEMKDCVVVGGGRIHAEAIEKAREVGVAALVSGGLDDQDLRNFLGYDLGVAITGSEGMGISLVITEGFGDISMAERTFDLLRSHAGHFVSVNGATQIRAGVMRPEVLIPLHDQAAAFDVGHAGHAAGTGGGILDVGKLVRIIRDPYFGMIGEVSSLPSETRVLDSGSRARILEVKLSGEGGGGVGEVVVIPRANVELIEG